MAITPTVTKKAKSTQYTTSIDFYESLVDDMCSLSEKIVKVDESIDDQTLIAVFSLGSFNLYLILAVGRYSFGVFYGLSNKPIANSSTLEEMTWLGAATRGADPLSVSEYRLEFVDLSDIGLVFSCACKEAYFAGISLQLYYVTDAIHGNTFTALTYSNRFSPSFDTTLLSLSLPGAESTASGFSIITSTEETITSDHFVPNEYNIFDTMSKAVESENYVLYPIGFSGYTASGLAFPKLLWGGKYIPYDLIKCGQSKPVTTQIGKRVRINSVEFESLGKVQIWLEDGAVDTGSG